MTAPPLICEFMIPIILYLLFETTRPLLPMTETPLQKLYGVCPYSLTTLKIRPRSTQAPLRSLTGYTFTI